MGGYFLGGKELRAMFLRQGAALRISMVRSTNSSNRGLLNRVLAQTEITFSNSMIESWWSAHKQLDYLVTEFVE
jgi:hypothetical protein